MSKGQGTGTGDRDRDREKPKKSGKGATIDTPLPKKQSRFHTGGRAQIVLYNPNTPHICCIFVKTLTMKNYNGSGLTVKGGRLINERSNDCMAPITEAAIMRKAMKREKKVEMIAEGVMRGDMRAEIYETKG